MKIVNETVSIFNCASNLDKKSSPLSKAQLFSFIDVFTEWSANPLNSEIQNLEFKNRVFIMNKLSYAPITTKSVTLDKDKFIKSELVNQLKGSEPFNSS
ncbi:MAG: hypothetical protein ACC657_05175 [Thiohalomonadales bacterium]